MCERHQLRFEETVVKLQREGRLAGTGFRRWLVAAEFYFLRGKKRDQDAITGLWYALRIDNDDVPDLEARLHGPIEDIEA